IYRRYAKPATHSVPSRTGGKFRFLQQNNILNSGLSQMVSSADAHNATANDYNFGFIARSLGQRMLALLLCGRRESPARNFKATLTNLKPVQVSSPLDGGKSWLRQTAEEPFKPVFQFYQRSKPWAPSSDARHYGAALTTAEVVIGDGGFVFALEKRRATSRRGRGHRKRWSRHPEAVRQLHREFLRAGSDRMTSFPKRGNTASPRIRTNINAALVGWPRRGGQAGRAAALFLGRCLPDPTYLQRASKMSGHQGRFPMASMPRFQRRRVSTSFSGEYFEHVEEAEWAIEVAGWRPTARAASSMCIGPQATCTANSAGTAAIRMARAGWPKCGQLPTTIPLAYNDSGHAGQSRAFIDLPDVPIRLWRVAICNRLGHAPLRQGGLRPWCRASSAACCGFEPYHIRAVCRAELAAERGAIPSGSEKHVVWGGRGLKMHTKPWVRARANREYWENLNPASAVGRYSSAMSKAGQTAGRPPPATRCWMQHARARDHH
uniref:Hcy-binding domain-containing protein n=1 Tax=Macrostomum lignano TaxID=282301 RepID=A0A1I8FQT2_9PLAT